MGKEKEEELYLTAAAALRYAERQGYPFGKSKFYIDLKYIPKKGNKFAKNEIDKYIKDLIIQSSGLTASDEAAEKIRQETRAARGRADKLEFQNEVAHGLYIPITELEKELSGRASLLKGGIENFFETHGRKMIEESGGDPSKEGDLVNYCLEEIDNHFDQYSRNMEFDVPVINSENEDTEE